MARPSRWVTTPTTFTSASPLSSDPGEKPGRYSSLLEPGQWDKLLDRIGSLDQPDVPIKPSSSSLPAKSKRSSQAHAGE